MNINTIIGTEKSPRRIFELFVESGEFTEDQLCNIGLYMITLLKDTHN